MREIIVSTAVFAYIWSKREEGEESENQILERLFSLDTPGDFQNLKSNQSIEAVASRIPSTKREKRNRNVGIQKDSWLSIVVSAFRSLGNGPHHLSAIYDAVSQILPDDKKGIGKLEETVRGTIYDNCPTSERFKGAHSAFRKADEHGRGYWELIV